MPVSTIDPTAALVIVDLQRGLAGAAVAPHPFDAVVAEAVALATAFRGAGLPVVVVTVDGVPPGRTDHGPREFAPPAEWSEPVDELGAAPNDLRVVKQTPGAFIGTDLHRRLSDLGVTQVVLVGVSTSVGVEMTAREAFELGYNVTVAIDGCTDTSGDAHTHSVERVLPRVAETGSAADVLARLARRS